MLATKISKYVNYSLVEKYSTKIPNIKYKIGP